MNMTTKITAAPVERDACGWWSHPGLPDFDEGDEDKFQAWLAEQQLELMRVWMEVDNEELYNRYYPDAGEGDPAALCDWRPAAPSDDPTWFLLCICETEDDGPCAYFARRVSAPAP